MAKKLTVLLFIIVIIATTVAAREQKLKNAPIADGTKQYHETSKIIPLTAGEKTWLRKHKTIRVGMSPVFPPLKFQERGVLKGIEPDYLRLLSEYTGIKFDYVICSFPVMDSKVKSGEIDMFLSFYIPERLSYMTFTEPLMDFKHIVIARKDTAFMSGIGALKGKKVAVVKGVKLYNKLLSPYPGIEAVEVDTMEQMFEAVSESRAGALISRTYYAGYTMQNYPELKIVGVLDLPPEPYLYAVRRDYPELVSILNKAIASVSRETHDAIVQKWFTVRVEYRPNWSEILKWVLTIGGILILILGLSLFWNRRLAREIVRRKQLEDKLHALAIIDDLTGLYNRRGFLTLARQQMKVAERTKKDMLLFFADLDKMKQINDTLGHTEGDKALAMVATILKDVFRESDIIGRMGGDEFAILAIDTADETEEVLMKRLHNSLEAHNKLNGREYTLSFSIGIAHYRPEDSFSFDDLLAQADKLMYEEKRNKQY